VYNCRLDGTFPPHPDNRQGTQLQMNFTDKQQVKVGVTSANEGAGVVRSGRDLVKILRLLPICRQCLFEWDTQDAHLVKINSESRSVCTSFAFMCTSFLLLGHCPAFHQDCPGKGPVWPGCCGVGAGLREPAEWWMSGVFLLLLCSYCSFKWWCWTVLQGF